MLVNLWKYRSEVLCGVDVEVGLVFWELRDSRPRSFGWCAHETEDLLKLVFIGGTREERASCVHFCHDAASRPDIDARVIGSTTKEHIRGTIPQRYDFIGECIDGNTECAGKAEICQFQLAFGVDKEVLRFEVPM